MNRFLIITVLLAGCSSQPSDGLPPVLPDTKRPTVVVTSYALFAMATEIGGDSVTVIWPAMEATDPQLWQPTADDIRLLQSADAILLNGAGYEPWVQNLSLPRSRTIDTSLAYRDRLKPLSGKMTHQHGPQGAAVAGQVVSATWLDSDLAIRQLRQVETCLVELADDSADRISNRASSLADSLEQVSAAVDEIAAQVPARRVAADSSDFDYLIASLNWERISSGTEPADSNGTEVVYFFEAGSQQPLPASATEHGMTPVSIDVCRRVDADESFVERLQSNVDALRSLSTDP
ncbi:MAG: zinc ABC transporter substrate-binding protein [Planctomycetaceae bacterium]